MFQQEIEAMKQPKVNQVFYSPAQLARALGVGTTKLYQLIKLDDFPKPTSNPHFRNKYNFQEVQAWIKHGYPPKPSPIDIKSKSKTIQQAYFDGFITGYERCSVDCDNGQWTNNQDELEEYAATFANEYSLDKVDE